MNFAPFNDPDSAVSKAGLKLKSCHSKLTKCPYEAAFLAAGGVGGTMSNIDYANSLIPTCGHGLKLCFARRLRAGMKRYQSDC